MVVVFSELIANFNDFETYLRKAKEIEKNADFKTHDIIEKLNKTFITPFDREDIYLLAHEFDDIVDLFEIVIRNINIYKVTRKLEAFDKFVPLMQEAAGTFEELFECLKGQKYTEKLIELKIKIHDLEDQGDNVFNEAIGRLFESGEDALYIIKLKDLLEGMENIMDKFQKVADIIEGIVVKSSS